MIFLEQEGRERPRISLRLKPDELQRTATIAVFKEFFSLRKPLVVRNRSNLKYTNR